MRTQIKESVGPIAMNENRNLKNIKFHEYNSEGEIVEISLEEYERGLTDEEFEKTLEFVDRDIERGEVYSLEEAKAMIEKHINERLQNRIN